MSEVLELVMVMVVQRGIALSHQIGRGIFLCNTLRRMHNENYSKAGQSINCVI